MARGEVEAGIYHVYSRGNRREAIFEDDADHDLYLDLLRRAVKRTGWHAMAYCLMRNHFHLLIETREPNLAAGMQWLEGCYAQAFNRRHRYVGHVFQERYGAKRIRYDAQFWTVVRYIARNPVEAGLCNQPDGWRWSSFALAPAWLDTQRLQAYLRAAGRTSSLRELIGDSPP
jgi:REP element-mobilizing transposase RayT